MDYDRIRALHRRYVADIIGVIYNGIVHQTPKVKVLGLLKREFDALDKEIGGLSMMEVSYLRSATRNIQYLIAKNSLVQTRKASKGVNYQEFIKNRSEAVFDSLRKTVVDSGIMVKTMNEGIRMAELSQKEREMRDLMRDNDGYTPFVVCDVHENCAKDHEAYQGKVYIKDNWEEYVRDEEIRGKIRAYVRNHRCKTVDSVTRHAPYLVFRPNCRHRLYDVSIDDVLNSSVRKIIKDKKLFKSGIKNISDAGRVCRAYKDRLDLYRELWKVAPNPKLGEEINKTEKLYKKWKIKEGR